MPDEIKKKEDDFQNFFNIKVTCTECGKEGVNWISRVKDKGICKKCFYKKVGTDNPQN